MMDFTMNNSLFLKNFDFLKYKHLRGIYKY